MRGISSPSPQFTIPLTCHLQIVFGWEWLFVWFNTKQIYGTLLLLHLMRLNQELNLGSIFDMQSELVAFCSQLYAATNLAMRIVTLQKIG